MHIIAKSALVKFWESQTAGLPRDAARAALTSWHTTVSDAVWNDFNDLRKTFNSADYVADGKVVFDVGGNKYRLVGLVGYRTKRVFVLFVGTHADDDRISVKDL
ncbi:type II toxin-antitoxin system HigB family toxin [Rhizobium sp. TRM95796]|uniref:type II toxin-antitoxin system HigB family toxin n=1 Tax=Rhizobium sp. TRM95796 TaxID=2979862 RepID=UPI0021E7841F|nr:type II toxin-antitoxin system HigB family toxin [Rhizobium sp. TRM95796]MCV3764323.1 type II toxin-antitoxin system HigB family toxin [Rhizobium sp. TRM95796]